MISGLSLPWSRAIINGPLRWRAVWTAPGRSLAFCLPSRFHHGALHSPRWEMIEFRTECPARVLQTSELSVFPFLFFVWRRPPRKKLTQHFRHARDSDTHYQPALSRLSLNCFFNLACTANFASTKNNQVFSRSDYCTSSYTEQVSIWPLCITGITPPPSRSSQQRGRVSSLGSRAETENQARPQIPPLPILPGSVSVHGIIEVPKIFHRSGTGRFFDITRRTPWTATMTTQLDSRPEAVAAARSIPQSPRIDTHTKD